MAKKKKKTNKLDDIKLFDDEEINFSVICKFIRETLCVTQEQMAQKLGITVSTYGYWEYGKYVPKGEPAFNLCLLYLHAKEQAKKQTSPENNSQEFAPNSDSSNYKENQAA